MNICPHVRQILKHSGIMTLGMWIKTTWKIAANITEYEAMDRRRNKGLPVHAMGGEIVPHHRQTAYYKTWHTDPELDT